jgi:hypothetical protein
MRRRSEEVIGVMDYTGPQILTKVDALLHRGARIRSRIDYPEDNISVIENGWEPNIVAFCCRHCAYAAADLAGSLRLEYPASVKVVELPCTGKFDVLYAMRAFEDGADGVMVAG